MLKHTKSPLEKAKDAEAGKRLLQGRTETNVTRLMNEIDATKATVGKAQEHLNECLEAGVETTTAAEVLLRAESHLRALESGLIVARKKHEQAIDDWKQAKQHVAIETEVEAVEQAKCMIAEEVDPLILALERACMKVGPSLKNALEVLHQSGMNELEFGFLRKVPQVLKQLLLLAAHNVTMADFVPPTSRDYRRVSDVIPDQDFVRSRPRPGPSPAKPIPAWASKD